MASTSSLGASSSTSVLESQQFYERFRARLQDLTTQIEAASSTKQLQQVTRALADARRQLTDATAFLPTYDQQAYEQQFRQLTAALARRRTQVTPDSNRRFRFQRKPASEREEKMASPVAGTSNAPMNGESEPRETDREKNMASQFASISDCTGEDITPEKIKAITRDNTQPCDLHLTNLTRCKVDLRRPLSEQANDARRWLALQIRNVKDCELLLGHIDGSVMIHDAEDCTIILGCRQFRMHSSLDCIVVLSTQSIATIEHCSDIRFGPAPEKLLRLPEKGEIDDEKAPAECGSGPGVRVQDFDHISTSTPSPNWTSLSECDWIDIELDYGR